MICLLLKKIGITPYDKVKELITEQEYEDLPCKYLEAVLYRNKCNKEDFIEILNYIESKKKGYKYGYLGKVKR